MKMNNVLKYDCGYFPISRMNLTSTEGAYLYKEEASWAAMGTSLAKRSGPVTVGSVGLTGRAFTRGAPRKTKNIYVKAQMSIKGEHVTKCIQKKRLLSFYFLASLVPNFTLTSQTWGNLIQQT